MGVSCIRRIITGKEKEHAKAFAERCLQMLTLFPTKYLLGRDFPHTASQSHEFSFSALESVFNRFHVLSK